MNWGMRRPSIEGPCQEETGWPLGKMVVVVVVAAAAAVVVVVCLNLCGLSIRRLSNYLVVLVALKDLFFYFC